MHCTIRLLGPGDDAVLERVAPEVFDGPVNPQWTAEFLADARHHLVVAVEGELVIGMASAVHYLHPDKAPQLWINEVAVTPTHRRRGIGRLLIEYSALGGQPSPNGSVTMYTFPLDPPADRSD